MPPTISVQTIASRKLAAVRRQVFIPQIAAACRPALDQVWAFLREHPGLHTGGPNVFLYRHPASMTEPMTVDFGVEVARAFDPSGDVHAVDTPAGEAVVVLHVGPYSCLPQTHAVLHAWAAANNRPFAGTTLEIYGDWCEDESKLETTVAYLLQP